MPKRTISFSRRVGSVLAELRVKAYINQDVLAEAVGVGQSTWSKVEHGLSALTITQLHKAASILGKDPSAILRRAERAE